MRQTKARLAASDINGAWAILATPAKDNASDWRAENTVDLDETARVVEALIAAGVDGLLSLGTFGECATLTWDEKRAFMATVVETARGRIPYFGGTSSLNTRETVRQTRAAYDLGVNGTMLGPPMWCYPDTATSLQFYRDVAEACPDLAICVYANPEAFKFDFPRPFWAQITQIPQVVSAKIVGIATLDHCHGTIVIFPNHVEPPKITQSCHGQSGALSCVLRATRPDRWRCKSSCPSRRPCG